MSIYSRLGLVRTVHIEEGFIKKAKANYHRCFLGENGRPHDSIYKVCVADELIEGRQGQKCGGMFVYYIFCYKSIGFPSNVLRHSSK